MTEKDYAKYVKQEIRQRSSSPITMRSDVCEQRKIVPHLPRKEGHPEDTCLNQMESRYSQRHSLKSLNPKVSIKPKSSPVL